jgi:hypothetical protein
MAIKVLVNDGKNGKGRNMFLAAFGSSVAKSNESDYRIDAKSIFLPTNL